MPATKHLTFFSSGLVLLLAGCGGDQALPPGGPSAEATTSSKSPAESGTRQFAPEAPPANAKVTPAPDAKLPASSEPPANTDELRELAAQLIEKDEQGIWRIRESAALELEKRGDAAWTELVPLIHHKQADVRRGAAFYVLARFEPSDKAHVEAFSSLLSDSEPFLRSLGLKAVRQMRAADQIAAVPRLTGMLDPKQEASADNRAALARFLGTLKSGASSALPDLARCAQDDESPKARSACILAVSQIGSAQDVLPVLQAGLADQDASVRLVAAARLRQLGNAAAPAANELAAALEDADEKVRDTAAEGLIAIGKEAVPSIGKRLESPQPVTRSLALACLGKIGRDAKDVLPLVEKRLNDENPEVKQLAAAVVRILKGNSGGD